MMRDAAKPVRPSKRDVIVLDDDGQPLAKSVKRDEPVPSPEVVKLQQENEKLLQEVAEKEDMFQRACRAAHTAESRAAAAESKLDSKYGIKGDAEKKRAADLDLRLSQLEEARRTADSTAKSELERENEALKAQMNAMTKKYHDRIDYLTQKLAQYEGVTEMQPTMQSSVRAETADVGIRLFEDFFELHDVGHPTNILQLCNPDSSEAMPFEIGSRKLLFVMDEIKKGSLLKNVEHYLDYLERTIASPHCKACNETPKRGKIIDHFFGTRHQKEVSALGAAVSRAAFEYWLEKLESVVAAQPAVEAAEAAAAKIRGSNLGLELHETGHPTNIFQTCSPNSSESTSFLVAFHEIRYFTEIIDSHVKVKHQSRKFYECQSTGHCGLCEKTPKNNREIIAHFLSPKHQRKFLVHGAAVSSAALKYWKDKLQA